MFLILEKYADVFIGEQTKEQFSWNETDLKMLSL